MSERLHVAARNDLTDDQAPVFYFSLDGERYIEVKDNPLLYSADDLRKAWAENTDPKATKVRVKTARRFLAHAGAEFQEFPLDTPGVSAKAGLLRLRP